MPNPDLLKVLGVVVAAMVLFITGKLRIDVVALCVLATLVVLGLIESNQILYGFANPATATVAAMFVLSAALVRTGLVQWLVHYIDRLAGKTEWRLVLVLCISIAALSAFVVNTATVAIFIPVAIVLAKSRNIMSSRVLMPRSFASQFGGVCTLIGTSTNIVVNSIAVSYGMNAFGLFEFAPLGLVMVAVGTGYLLIATPRLLPKRDGDIQQVDKYRLADYLAELRIKADSPLVGESWRKSKASAERDVDLIRLIRNERVIWKPTRMELKEGDILLLHGDAKKLIGLADKYGLDLNPDIAVGDEKLSSDEVKLIEALVPPASSLVGRTLRNAAFLRRYGSVVLALQRRGRIVRERLGDIRLEGGDTLLLQGDKNDVARLMKSSDLIVTNELTELYFRRDRAIIALLVLTAVVAAAALKILPIMDAALLGVVGMLLGQCIDIEEAYKAIDWKVIFLLGGILPLGLAMEQSGAALWVTNTVLSPFVVLGPLAVLAILYLVTAILTETMSNNAAAVILAPIALSMAASMNVDPKPFLVAITFAASTSFATPIGYQTNTMIYAPGGYRFVDFLRVGGPLNIVFWAIALVLIPLLWPF
jgi:di/tricarboxylate transporter